MFAARFQSFEDSGDRGASAPRVAALRAELARRGLDGFVVPRADRFQNEYVPPCAERLAWLTGFTGSAGLAIVLADRAVLFVDGRYQVQVREEADGAIFSVEHLVEHPPHEWLEANLRAGARLGYSPWLHTIDGAERLVKACAAAGASLVPAADNPIDAIWTDRPPPPCGAVVLHDLRYAGESAQEKLARVRGAIEKASADALVVSDPHAVSWLFNIRGSDIPHTPVVLAFALVPREGRPALYVDGRKLGNDVRHRLEEIADVRASAEFEHGLAALGGERRKVRLDPSATPEAIARLLAESGGTILRGGDPIAPMKAVKNAAEIAGAQAAQLRDGAAVTRFLAWFDREAPAGRLTEIDAVEALESFRRDTGLLKDVSFPTIAGAGADGAVVHYRVTRRSNRSIAPGELFLIDSGAQYEDGTTDITRTIAVGAPGADMRGNFTRVLKGHIAIAARGVSRRHHRRPARFVRAAISLAGRARFRSRHRPRRRQLPLGARRPGAHLQARQRGAQARHDPVERARLLSHRRLRHPHRESGPGRRGAAGRRSGKAAQRLRDADLGADRHAARRAGDDDRGRDRLARRLSRAGTRNARSGRRCADARMADQGDGADRARVNRAIPSLRAKRSNPAFRRMKYGLLRRPSGSSQ